MASPSPVGFRFGRANRILDEPDYYVWCCSPLRGDDGLVHVYYSRWPRAAGFDGWLSCCEIAHAVAEAPEGPYHFRDVALRAREPGTWDSATTHNPTMHRVGDRYVLYYMGSAGDASTPWRTLVASQRIGVAVGDSPDGPWTRGSSPVLEPGPAGDWDDLMNTNPALLQHPSGQSWLYYKSMSRHDYDHVPGGRRKYGLAIADDPTGPFRKHPANPLVDVSDRHGVAQLEDAFVWREDGVFKMLARDMGTFDPAVGLYFTSPDGLAWSEPAIGYEPAPRYLAEAWSIPPELARFERPQLLFTNGRPSHLFVACRGGRHDGSTAVVLEILAS